MYAPYSYIAGPARYTTITVLNIILRSVKKKTRHGSTAAAEQVHVTEEAGGRHCGISLSYSRIYDNMVQQHYRLPPTAVISEVLFKTMLPQACLPRTYDITSCVVHEVPTYLHRVREGQVVRRHVIMFTAVPKVGGTKAMRFAYTISAPKEELQGSSCREGYVAQQRCPAKAERLNTCW